MFEKLMLVYATVSCVLMVCVLLLMLLAWVVCRVEDDDVDGSEWVYGGFLLCAFLGIAWPAVAVKAIVDAVRG